MNNNNEQPPGTEELLVTEHLTCPSFRGNVEIVRLGINKRDRAVTFSFLQNLDLLGPSLADWDNVPARVISVIQAKTKSRDMRGECFLFASDGNAPGSGSIMANDLVLFPCRKDGTASRQRISNKNTIYTYHQRNGINVLEEEFNAAKDFFYVDVLRLVPDESLKVISKFGCLEQRNKRGKIEIVDPKEYDGITIPELNHQDAHSNRNMTTTTNNTNTNNNKARAAVKAKPAPSSTKKRKLTQEEFEALPPCMCSKKQKCHASDNNDNDDDDNDDDDDDDDDYCAPVPTRATKARAITNKKKRKAAVAALKAISTPKLPSPPVKKQKRNRVLLKEDDDDEEFEWHDDELLGGDEEVEDEQKEEEQEEEGEEQEEEEQEEEDNGGPSVDEEDRQEEELPEEEEEEELENRYKAMHEINSAFELLGLPRSVASTAEDEEIVIQAAKLVEPLHRKGFKDFHPVALFIRPSSDLDLPYYIFDVEEEPSPVVQTEFQHLFGSEEIEEVTVIIDIKKDTYAHDAGLRNDDILWKVAGKNLSCRAELYRIEEAVGKQTPFIVLLFRPGKPVKSPLLETTLLRKGKVESSIQKEMNSEGTNQKLRASAKNQGNPEVSGDAKTVYQTKEKGTIATENGEEPTAPKHTNTGSQAKRNEVALTDEQKEPTAPKETETNFRAKGKESLFAEKTEELQDPINTNGISKPNEKELASSKDNLEDPDDKDAVSQIKGKELSKGKLSQAANLEARLSMDAAEVSEEESSSSKSQSENESLSVKNGKAPRAGKRPPLSDIETKIKTPSMEEDTTLHAMELTDTRRLSELGVGQVEGAMANDEEVEMFVVQSGLMNVATWLRSDSEQLRIKGWKILSGIFRVYGHCWSIDREEFTSHFVRNLADCSTVELYTTLMEVHRLIDVASFCEECKASKVLDSTMSALLNAMERHTNASAQTAVECFFLISCMLKTSRGKTAFRNAEGPPKVMKCLNRYRDYEIVWKIHEAITQNSWTG